VSEEAAAYFRKTSWFYARLSPQEAPLSGNKEDIRKVQEDFYRKKKYFLQLSK
jgi:hypothetical protein